jgi:peptide/nickel transport system substrate-binding protein
MIKFFRCSLHPGVLLLLILFVSACEIQGGVAPPTTPGTLPQPVEPTATPTVSVGDSPDGSTASASRQSTFQIGLLDKPSDLLPYHTDASDERISAPVIELLFPSPMIALDYSYTPTRVLQRMPTFANGDVEIRQTQVYLDETDTITTTETDVLTDAHQLVITYRWNPDLRWSDGEPLTADDSLFAYEQAQSAPLGDSASKRLLLVERYELVDEHTTRAFLNPYLPQIDEGALESPASLELKDTDDLLTFWTPLPRHALEDQLLIDSLAESDFARQPVSYGPYMLESNDADTIRLRRNSHYPASEPQPEADVVSFVFFENTDELYEALQQGSIDVAMTDQADAEHLALFESAQEENGLDVTFMPNPVWEHLDFNLGFRFLRDERIRHAIAYGTNRETMAEELTSGQAPVLDSWIVPDHWAAAPADQLTLYPYDPDQARVLLEEANVIDMDDDGVREQGIDHDSDGTLESNVPITLTLLTTADTPLRTAIAERFQQDMAEIGLAVQVAELPAEQIYSSDGPLFRREFELAQFAWIANPDPRGFELWSCAAVPSPINSWSGSNLPGWCSRDANQAIVTATTSLDWEERRDAYMQHQQLFTQALPSLPLFQRVTVVLANPNMQGLRPDPVAPLTWNIAEWRREET